MSVQLQWLKEGSSDPSSSGSAYLSEGESATVGRETGVDIQLTDSGVSRLHAEIYMENGTVIIKDAGSTNGTILDGKQVVQSRWEPGQSVRIGLPFESRCRLRCSCPIAVGTSATESTRARV